MSNIFCVSSYRSVGATFLDWSIHYLSGQDNFYSTRKNQTVKLYENPLSNLNAHNHPKNIASGIDEADRVLEELKQQNNDLLSYYIHPLHYTDCLKALGIDIDDVRNSNGTELNEKIENVRKVDYKQSLDNVNKSGADLIYLHSDKKINGYLWSERVLVPLDENKMISNEEKKNQSFFDFFYYKDYEFMARWDIREKRALDLRPYDDLTFVNPKLDFKHLWFDAQDLWGQAEDVATECVNFLNKQVDNKRLESWKPIAYKWQQTQNRNFSFARNLDHIIDYTINGYSYDISNLTFHQEVIIQHELIYKHNLNIKNWELEKFPNNTKELHKLLETNTHPVEKIYS